MAYPDQGPLLDEQLDEVELICQAGENNGIFPASSIGCQEDFDALDYVLGWHDRHDRKLLEAARWALKQGWSRESPAPGEGGKTG